MRDEDLYRRTIRRVCRRFMALLHARFHALAGAYYRAHPDARRMCGTCAFRRNFLKATGLEHTALNLQRSIEGQTKGFWCHKGLPAGPPGSGLQYDVRACLEQIRQGEAAMCVGFLVVRDDPEAASAFLAAAEILPEEEGA